MLLHRIFEWIIWCGMSIWCFDVWSLSVRHPITAMIWFELCCTKTSLIIMAAWRRLSISSWRFPRSTKIGIFVSTSGELGTARTPALSWAKQLGEDMIPMVAEPSHTGVEASRVQILVEGWVQDAGKQFVVQLLNLCICRKVWIPQVASLRTNIRDWSAFNGCIGGLSDLAAACFFHPCSSEHLRPLRLQTVHISQYLVRLDRE